MNSLNTFTVALLAIIFSTNVIAQDCANINVYNTCVSNHQAFEESTCGFLQSKNVTLYNYCLCYSVDTLAKCGLQCPSDPQVIARTAQVEANKTALCNAANLTFPLPSPAPWVTYFPNLGSSPTQTGGAKPSNTGSNNSTNKNSAEQPAGGVLKSFALASTVAMGFMLASLF